MKTATAFSMTATSPSLPRNAAVIAKLAETAQRLSGFGKEDLEELEKNSAETPVEGSPLD